MMAGVEPALPTPPNYKLPQGWPQHQVPACLAPAEQVGERLPPPPDPEEYADSTPPAGVLPTSSTIHSTCPTALVPAKQEAQHSSRAVALAQDEGCSDSPSPQALAPHTPCLATCTCSLQETVLL